ncbi:MAG TPA: sensor domain-containing diguanylate cyclase [Synergistaceae bacterium]|nr:sensor domain-containing diguanylate cyclase [Synergistaceae bacterium]
MENQVLQNPAFLQTLLNFLEEGVYVTDNSRKILFWNRGAEHITGFTAEEVVGSSCKDNILCHMDAKGKELCSSGCPLLQTLQDGKERESNLFLQHRKGYRLPVRVRITPLKNTEGTVVGAAEIFTDASSQSSVTEKLNLYRDLALKDQVTGIGNRRYGEIYLRSRLAAFQESHWPFGVCKVAINNVQEINAVHGHTLGDQLLKIAATSIAKIMPAGDFIARWGGGEFLLVLLSARSKADITAAGNRFKLVAQRSTLWVEGKVILPSISFGGTVTEKGDSAEDLLQRASKALLASKVHKEHMVIVY